MTTPSGGDAASEARGSVAGSVPWAGGGPALPSTVRLWAALVAVHAMLDRALERDASTCGIAGPDAIGVLRPLAQAPGHRLRLHDLAGRAGLTPSGLTRRLDELVGAGLIVRASCDQDRRGTYAALTESGMAALPPALAHHAAVLDRELHLRLDPPSINALAILLERLASP